MREGVSRARPLALLLPLGSQDRQKETTIAPGKFDVMVTSYEMVIK